MYQRSMVALCLGLLLGAASAGAEQMEDDACTRDPVCASLVTSAQALSQTRQYVAALSNYQQAYQLHPLPYLKLNIGRVQHKLGSTAEALLIYRELLADPIVLQDEELRSRTRRWLIEAQSDAARQQATPPPAIEPPPAGEPAVLEPPPIALTRHPGPTLAPPGANPPVTPVTPLYRRWWLWTAVGAVTLVGVGVGLGVGLSAQPGLSPPPALPAGTTVLSPMF